MSKEASRVATASRGAVNATTDSAVTGETRGFAEERQAEYDMRGLRDAVEAGREFTIMQNGKAVATVAPTSEKKARVPGRFAHLRGSLLPDMFDQPLEQDELDAWEGKYSGGGDR